MEAPEKRLDSEFISELEIISDKVHPLPGATFNRPIDIDPRLKNIHAMAGMPLSPTITYYEHIASVRNLRTNKFYVSFRQTKDAQLIEFNDPIKYPEWLMKSSLKDTELSIYIYKVKEYNGKPIFPKDVPVMRTHEDWLEHITDVRIFDSLAYFLLRKGVINYDVYNKL